MRAEQDLLSGLALASFRLNGQFLDVAEGMARPLGLTAAWWQVLGAVLTQPQSVAGISREMGITRQSVQRIADLLVERGLAEYRPNPAHRRAKLVAPTPKGRQALSGIDPAHAELANRLTRAMGEDELADTLAAMRRLSTVLDQLGDDIPATTPTVPLPSTTHDWSRDVDHEHVRAIQASPAAYAPDICHLVLEVLAYPLDEADWGATNEVVITLHTDGSISVSDNGRGTDTRLDAAGRPIVKPIMSTRDLRFFDVTDAPLLLDGVRRSGISVVCALSVSLTHTNRRVNGAWAQRYAFGLPDGAREEIPGTQATGTTVRFRPHPGLFGVVAPSADQLRKRCAPLQGVATISVVDEVQG